MEKAEDRDASSSLILLKRPLSSADLSCRKRSASETVIKIVSATYGPSEGHRLLTGELSNDAVSCIPYTRDVAPFLRALLVKEIQEDSEESDAEDAGYNVAKERNRDNESDLLHLRIGRRRIIPLMDGRQMNVIFGDPYPGTSKRLSIHYVTYESNHSSSLRASVASEVHRVTFAEHERVLIRPRATFYQDDATLQNAIAAAAKRMELATITEAHVDNEDTQALQNARRMGRAQSISELAELLSQENDSVALLHQTTGIEAATSAQAKWRLRSATSEIALPIALPFLRVRERVKCKLVCHVWRNVIQDHGVAKNIDVNDDTTFPNFTLPILRGLLSQSHHSLQNLFLGEFQDLTKGDLHPAIPHLRKLKRLDISRCNDLDDSTLLLLSEHVSSTLRVLYLKGLRNVTDKGIIAATDACTALQVLDISYVPITDEAGISIGVNLTQLRALYLRDNYLLTNRSIDVITENCGHLSQLTLWGVTKLKNLTFYEADRVLGYGKLVVLNLWGCHGLIDNVALALGTMRNLRSLIVSECHRLTNTFLFGLANSAPQLNHLHLRYCKKVTDDGVNAISDSMKHLYSLDLSFCSRVTFAALLNLLEIRQETLTELRLQSNPHLDVARDLRHHSEFPGNNSGEGRVGLAILHCLQAAGKRSNLSVLDLRGCGGFRSETGYPSDDPFVLGMSTLQFKQPVDGFFQRPNRPNPELYDLLLNHALG